MQPIKAIIFDMDGTLYSFDEKEETHFRSSTFGKQIHANCIQFLQERLHLEPSAAHDMYLDLSKHYNNEVSLAVEKEFGIQRSEYFAATWDIPVEEYLVENPELAQTLQDLSIPTGVLTAAPKIWAEKALQFLQIRDIFGEAIFTGDPDIRKPNPLAFQQLADFWNIRPSEILAIGDQEWSDILPAQSLGMKTLRIAKQTTTQADFVAPNILSALRLLKQKGVL